MSNPRKPSLAARIFPPAIPPRTHSLPAQYQTHCSTSATSTHPAQHPIHSTSATKTDLAMVQQPAAVALGPTHRRPIACQAPIIFYDSEEKSRREQTAESEKAREEILKQGIKVRDFQAELDEKRFAHGGGSARDVHRPGDQERRS